MRATEPTKAGFPAPSSAVLSDDVVWWGGWSDTSSDFVTTLFRTAAEVVQEAGLLGIDVTVRQAHGHELGPGAGGDPWFAIAEECAFCRYARPLPPPGATAGRDRHGQVWLAIADPDAVAGPTWVPVQDWHTPRATSRPGVLFDEGLYWDRLAVQYGSITCDAGVDPRPAGAVVTWLTVEAYTATLTPDGQRLLAAAPAGSTRQVSGELEDALIDLETEPHFLGSGARLLTFTPVPGTGDPAAGAAEWLAQLAPRAYPAEGPEEASARRVVDLHGVSVSVTLRRDGTAYVHFDTTDAVGPAGSLQGVRVEVNGSGIEHAFDLP